MTDKMDSGNKNEFSLRDVLRVIFRYKIVVVSVLIVVVASAYIGLAMRIPMYQSQVRILVTGQMQKDIEYDRELGPGSLVETQSKLVLSLPVMERVVKALKLDQRPLDYEKRYASALRRVLIEWQARKLQSELAEMPEADRRSYLFKNAVSSLMSSVFTAPVGQQSSLFEIRVNDYSPTGAAILANVVSRSYVIFDIEQQIAELELSYGERNPTIVKLEDYIEKLKDSLDGRPLPDIEALGPASVKIVTQATMGTPVPMKPGMTSGIIIALILGLVLGVTLAYVFDYFDQTVRTRQDVETYLHSRLLESLPYRKSIIYGLIDFSNSHDRYIQTLMNLAEKIFAIMKNDKLKSILVTDIEGLQDTCSIILNIGLYLAQKTGKRVLVVDANLRDSHSVTSVLNMQNNCGLVDFVTQKASLEECVSMVMDNYYVLPSSINSANPVAALESRYMSELVKSAEDQFEIVLVHSASLKDYTDAVVLAPSLDGTVLVLNEGKVKKQVVRSYLEPLYKKEVNIVGIVLNNRVYDIPELIYRIT